MISAATHFFIDVEGKDRIISSHLVTLSVLKEKPI